MKVKSVSAPVQQLEDLQHLSQQEEEVHRLLQSSDCFCRNWYVTDVQWKFNVWKLSQSDIFWSVFVSLNFKQRHEDTKDETKNTICLRLWSGQQNHTKTCSVISLVLVAKETDRSTWECVRLHPQPPPCRWTDPAAVRPGPRDEAKTRSPSPEVGGHRSEKNGRNTGSCGSEDPNGLLSVISFKSTCWAWSGSGCCSAPCWTNAATNYKTRTQTWYWFLQKYKTYELSAPKVQSKPERPAEGLQICWAGPGSESLQGKQNKTEDWISSLNRPFNEEHGGAAAVLAAVHIWMRTNVPIWVSAVRSGSPAAHGFWKLSYRWSRTRTRQISLSPQF